MKHNINFIQTDKWILNDFKLILEKPSGNKTKEDRYYGLEYNGEIIWLDRDITKKIDSFLEENFIDLEALKEDSIYDFKCKCAEGVPSYNRHGAGRCDGCHGEIFK